MQKQKNIALVHDFFIVNGGAEKVCAALLKLPYTTSLYASISYQPQFEGKDVRTTFMQKLPFLKEFLTIYKLLLPYAFESIHFPADTDIVISDTASFAKFIIVPPGATHISYIHTPPRFLWNLDASLKARQNFFARFIYNFFFGTSQRVADFLHAQRVHVLVANSKDVAARIKKFYRRDSIIIHPPVEVKQIIDATQNVKKKDSFLFLSRLEAYKKVDELIESWPEETPLTIGGSGSQLEYLQSKYAHRKNVTFLGYVPESEKWRILAEHKALLLPNREDFGIIMAEALAAGTPAIALNKGGAPEIVVHEKNGYLIENVTTNQLQKAIDWVNQQEDNEKYRKTLRESVLQFDTEVFLTKMRDVIENHAKHE
ncbi:MAG: glycosyltransferase [Candidatus Dojkabacteria bacterium]|nr:MAG: glycosyltransferase [Candidatus Dojkabacteria bacterium]